MVDATPSNNTKFVSSSSSRTACLLQFAFASGGRRENMLHAKNKKKKKKTEKTIIICRIFFASCENRMTIYFRLIQTAEFDGDDPQKMRKEKIATPRRMQCVAITFVPSNESFGIFFCFLFVRVFLVCSFLLSFL